MPRRKPPVAQAGQPPAAVPVVDPRAVYTIDSLRGTLGLKLSTVRREWREGRLKVSRRAGRVFVLGAWVLAWLEAGVSEAPKRASATARSEDN